MTEENYKYRTSPFLLRNQFKGKGKLQVPIIPRFQSKEDDFTDLRLIGFDKPSLKAIITSTAWCISFFTITNLNVYGRTLTQT